MMDYVLTQIRRDEASIRFIRSTRCLLEKEGVDIQEGFCDKMS